MCLKRVVLEINFLIFGFGLKLELNLKTRNLVIDYILYKKYLFDFLRTNLSLKLKLIVRSAWKDIPVKNIPIQVLYDPTERVFHFRPFKDFTRISILNTVLVTISIVLY